MSSSFTDNGELSPADDWDYEPQEERRGTMPPPELMDRPAPTSVGELVLEGVRAAAPVPRHQGPRAELFYWRGRVEAGRAENDSQAERDACISLCRLLATRGTELDKVTILARRALAIGDDSSLRTELAGWLAGLGEPALAAAALRGSVDSRRPSALARTLVKVAVLLGRSGDATGALDALQDASRLDPADPMANELVGTVASWASEHASAETAAKAYLDAARRRDVLKEKEAAFEDRLRAFEIAPHNDIAANEMAAAVLARGRNGAADEVMRAHAASLLAQAQVEGTAPPAVLDIHQQRMVSAVKEGDMARAVGCLLDAQCEADIDGEASDETNIVFKHAGLHELVAIRLEMRGERQTGFARSTTYEALARLYAGPLASSDRAIEAWIEAAVSDPANVAARAALREHAATLHGMGPLIEALVRIGEATDKKAREDPAERLLALQELASLAEEKIASPGLASWAFEMQQVMGGDTKKADEGVQRVAAALKSQNDALGAARRALRSADSEEGRVDALRRLVVIYRDRPNARGAYQEVLTRLASALPTDRGCLLALERLSRRTGDSTALEAVIRARLVAADQERENSIDPPPSEGSRSLTRTELMRIRLLLSTINRRRGALSQALDDIVPLLIEAPGHRGVASAALVLATQTGRLRERADALVQLASPLWPGMRALLLSIAAELYAAKGDLAIARNVADLACEADSSCARALVTRSAIAVMELQTLENLLGQSGLRIAAAAIERAITTVLPRSTLCDELASALEWLGELPLSLAWTQRWLALRPGCPQAMSELFRRASASRDATRLSEAIAWVLAQPKPLGDMEPQLLSALDALLPIDRARALSLARRCLDVFGPRTSLMRERLLEFALNANDVHLTITVLERWLAIEPTASHAHDLMFMIADCRIDTSDLDGAALLLARAAVDHASADQVVARMERIETMIADKPFMLGSDGLMAMAEAKAHTLAALKNDTSGEAALAWRELGALLWDLADDRRGAEQAFFRASEFAKTGGIECYARDLAEFAGAEGAFDALVARAFADGRSQAMIEERQRFGPLSSPQAYRDRRRHAAMLVEAATLASEQGLAERALAAAASAIEVDPSRADAVAIVEKNSHVEGGISILDKTYQTLADAAFGCYGRRAAHYRASRQLERRGVIALALSHAAKSFEAVPGEGTTFLVLSRLAERAGDPTEAVHAIERVAARGDGEFQSAWLKKAASFTGRTEEGLRMRIDLLLRALNACPDPQTVQDVGTAILEIASLAGEADAETIRFDRAIKAMLPKLDGPEGARASLAMACIAIQVLDAPILAIAAIERAIEANADIDEYDTLTNLIPSLAQEPDHSSLLIAAVYSKAMKPHANVGPSLLRWASRLAHAVKAIPIATALLVEAVRRAPDNDSLIDETEAAVQRLGEEALRRSLNEAVPVAHRVEVLLRVADKYAQSGDDVQALQVVQRALASGGLSGDARDKVVARLRHLYTMAKRPAQHETLLRSELARPDLSDLTRLKLARELASILSARGDLSGAFDILAAAAEKVPLDRELLAELGRLARHTDRRRYTQVLTRLLNLPSQSDRVRLLIMRELAPLVNDLGDHAAAMDYYEAIAKLDPTDSQALEVLETDATERSDHVQLAAVLARRIASASSVETRRALRLRRAAVLEQRLGRLDEACTELDNLLAVTPDDVSALRFSADIHERLGASLKAAQRWRKLCELATADEEKVDYGLRACTAYIAAEDLMAAKMVLDAFAPHAPRQTILERRVQIARLEGDMHALATSLGELAETCRDTPQRCVDLLIEASRATSNLGDTTAALDYARRAAQLDPESPDAGLELHRLEYRRSGTGTPRDAQATVDELNRIADHLRPAQIELHAFLLAEFLDVIQGHGAGMRELNRRHAEIGPTPLLALGMAERLVLKKNFHASLPLFDKALSGDLHGMRTRGRVALTAAQAAQGAGDAEGAARFLEIAMVEPDTRTTAQRRKLELNAASSDPETARRALEALASQSTGLDRGRALVQLARLLLHDEPERAKRLTKEASSLVRSDRSLTAQIAEISAEIDIIQPPPAPKASPAPKPPVIIPKPTPSSDSPVSSKSTLRLDFSDLSDPLDEEWGPTLSDSSDLSQPDQPDATVQSSPSNPPSPSSPPSISNPPPPSALRLLNHASWPPAPEEAQLFRELENGSFDAGERLMELFAQNPQDRSREALAVRRMQASLRLGDRGALERLSVAALADQNPVYARSIEHVLHAFDISSSDTVAPPPLIAQRDAPDLVTALLFRDIETPVNEALAIVWETGLFRKEAAQCGLTGVARIQPGPATVVSEVYGVVASRLGSLRTSLFHLRSAAQAEPSVVPLSPPAVVLRGDIRDETAEFRYLMGAYLAGAMPEHVLVNTASLEELQTLLEALVAAFGPLDQAPPSHRSSNPAVVRLEQNLWQLIHHRGERRLREICEIPDDITIDRAVLATKTAMRRAGLFASGDLASAIFAIVKELGIGFKIPLSAPNGLASACQEHPEVADLVNLATRMEYAEARWQPGAPISNRRSDPGRRSSA